MIVVLLQGYQNYLQVHTKTPLSTLYGQKSLLSTPIVDRWFHLRVFSALLCLKLTGGVNQKHYTSVCFVTENSESDENSVDLTKPMLNQALICHNLTQLIYNITKDFYLK